MYCTGFCRCIHSLPSDQMSQPTISLIFLATIASVLCHSHHGQAHDRHEHNDEMGSPDHHMTLAVDANSWDRVVANDEHVWVVKFFSSLCGGCKR